MTSSLDANLIRRSLSAEAGTVLDDLELFSSIASTNTYLLAQPSPEPRHFRVAIADHQSSGRGRHFRRWVSPPGAGLFLSFAYTFDEQPKQLSSLTLAIGVGIANSLQELGVEGIKLKWPNDVVAGDGKLGGILTETQSRADDRVSVVVGIGLNIDLPTEALADIESDWARRPVDMASVVDELPARESIAASVIDGLHNVMHEFGELGFDAFADEWASYDWLRGRDVTVDLPDKQISGIAAGVARDGAFLVDTGTEKMRVVSGSIILAGLPG